MFRIRETGIGKIVVELEGLEARARDLSAPLKQGRVLMLRSIDQNFQDAGRPKPWARLAKTTAAWKKKKGYSSLPLTRTGQLRRSIAGEVTRNSLRMGTAVSYGRHHHFGTKFMPARKFLIFQETDIANINRLVENFLKGKK